MKKNIYLITGFLGSGKTTLMKGLLAQNSNIKTAVIVNEFGKENVDAITLSKKDIVMNKISNGSIFCSCKSDLFIDALIKISNLDISNVFIETSGMSNPWSMPEIINIANKKTTNTYNYMGCLTIVDCNSFMKLSNMVVSINKQITFADYILLNKSDLITDSEKEKIKTTIESLNKEALIEFTSYCKVKDINTLLALHSITNKEKETFSTAAQSGVRKVLLEFKPNESFSKLIEFIKLISKDTYRIKGFMKLDGKNYMINCVHTKIEIELTTIKFQKNYIVLISDSKIPLKFFVSKIYKLIFFNSPTIKE